MPPHKKRQYEINYNCDDPGVKCGTGLVIKPDVFDLLIVAGAGALLGLML